MRGIRQLHMIQQRQKAFPESLPCPCGRSLQPKQLRSCSQPAGIPTEQVLRYAPDGRLRCTKQLYRKEPSGKRIAVASMISKRSLSVCVASGFNRWSSKSKQTTSAAWAVAAMENSAQPQAGSNTRLPSMSGISLEIAVSTRFIAASVSFRKLTQAVLSHLIKSILRTSVVPTLLLLVQTSWDYMGSHPRCGSFELPSRA